jgi:hypothetical protein
MVLCAVGYGTAISALLSGGVGNCWSDDDLLIISLSYYNIRIIEIQYIVCLNTLIRSQWPRGFNVVLRPLADWCCGFESRHGYRCLFIVSVMCCRVEVS